MRAARRAHISISRADSLLDRFSQLGVLPRDAIQEAAAHWDEVSPPFLAALQGYLRKPGLYKEVTEGLLLVVHLFAQMCDTRAYRPVLELVSLPEEDFDPVMGQSITETLNQVIPSLFDGDPDPLESAIVHPSLDEFVCNALFEALAFLTADGRISLDRTRAFVARCYHRALPRGEDSGMRWVGWQKVISYLALTEYVPMVRVAFRHGYVHPDQMDFHNFEEDLAASLKARERGELPPDPDLGYFQDVIAEFSRWHGFTPEGVREELRRRQREVMTRARIASWEPHVNPLRDVGRNDPCPCGSGRKYKKCCLGNRPAVVAAQT